MKKFLLLIFCGALLFTAHAKGDISILVPAKLKDTSIVSITVKDVQNLLAEACGCEVSINNDKATVLIELPYVSPEQAAKPGSFAKEFTSYPYFPVPEHSYTWKCIPKGNQTLLQLKTSSYQGISFGLYGLLQEKLGFKFYHPKQTFVPHWTKWPLNEKFEWAAKPLFDKKGFHLHTEHPLELTEQLMDGTLPHALEDVKQYIDWLARNGQNYFEFCLLESIKRKEWPAHAKAFTQYAHQRGILTAVDLSLHMIQQKTFQLYCAPPKSFRTKKNQIERNLEWLTQADWDFINMEFSTAEFIGGNYKKKEGYRLFIIKWLHDHTHTKLMGRQHVVKHENEAGHKKKGFEWDSVSSALDKERGVLSHTVMFYDMTEPNAPVYENKNQRHQFDFLLNQMKVRETWYYPESAYWVTFDNSVPMFLLPYLSARLNDIDTCVKYHVPGHVTFSSGWEWGYWLIDWSIARWSWQYAENGKDEKRTPAMYANEFLREKKGKELFNDELKLQQQYLKDSTLMQWMTAMTVTDEIPIKGLNNEYEPRPKWSYKFLRGKADSTTINTVRATILPQLQKFAQRTATLTGELKKEIGLKDDRTPLSTQDSVLAEWTDGLEITGLRAQHRFYSLSYLLCLREEKLRHTKCNCDSLLAQAQQVRAAAQQIVNRRQLNYRWPVSLIAAKRWDHTSYHFGYLYAASNLHFWEREEEQAKKNKYGPLFMNIWAIARIAGLID